MHFFEVEKALRAKYGDTVILVKDEGKIAHYTKTLGASLEKVIADTKAGTFEYQVFVRDLPCSSIGSKPIASETVTEPIPAKTGETPYDIVTPTRMLHAIKAIPTGEKYPYDHMLLSDKLIIQGAQLERIK
jgi:hypothetical protein